MYPLAQVSAGDIPDRKLSIHLGSIDNCGNSGRQTTKDSGQNREHQIVGDMGSWQRPRLGRDRSAGGLEFGAALIADDSRVLIKRSTLGTEHSVLPSNATSLLFATLINFESIGSLRSDREQVSPEPVSPEPGWVP